MVPAQLLLVDDEPRMLELLKEDFEAQGVECRTAENGQKALESVRDIPPDAILCDINMPVMDGLDLLMHLRKASIYTPLVFLTGHGEKDQAVRALRYGAFDFVNKPYHRKELMTTVFNALKFGIELRTLEDELDVICQSTHIKGQDLEKFRSLRRLFLRNKKHMKVLMSKAG